MKRKIALLTALFILTLSGLAQSEVGYWTGAWYDTAMPAGYVRTAGQIDIYQYDDGTVEVDVYYDGEESAYAEGTWTYSAITKKFTVRFTTDQGEIFVIKGTGSFWTGNYKGYIADKPYSGKCQLN